MCLAKNHLIASNIWLRSDLHSQKHSKNERAPNALGCEWFVFCSPASKTMVKTLQAAKVHARKFDSIKKISCTVYLAGRVTFIRKRSRSLKVRQAHWLANDLCFVRLPSKINNDIASADSASEKI